MPNHLEKLIKVVYKKWRQESLKAYQTHPDEEDYACFLEGRLPKEENERLKLHLLSCETCAQNFIVSLKLKPALVKNVPGEILKRMKDLVVPEDKLSALEIIILLKEKALEVLHATGDILLGQEFVPAPVLRSRKIKDFKDEVTILKDFKDIRVELKIENKGAQAFDLMVMVKDRQAHNLIKDLRVTLLKDDLELESYLTASDRVIFEHMLTGKYTVEISNPESRIASILLDIKK